MFLTPYSLVFSHFTRNVPVPARTAGCLHCCIVEISNVRQGEGVCWLAGVGLRVRIPPHAWMFVVSVVCCQVEVCVACCQVEGFEACVLSG
jgi:hypothetical protein